ncbi:MAG: InlB B-repeat-containing protein [Clostridia bacterium]|nr:InlB B-repeat-containing protein [Clostridia bacterium]
MKHVKKSLALLLSLALVLAMAPSISLTFTPKTQAAAAPKVRFYVPECVYLKVGEYGKQWYLNSYRNQWDQQDRKLEPMEETARLYFHCDGATSVTITTEGGTVRSLTCNGTDTIEDLDFEITGNGGDMITYTATFVVDGVTKTAKSYTYLYEPYRLPTGCLSEARGGGEQYLGYATLVWGAQRSDEAKTDGRNNTATPTDLIYLGNRGLYLANNRKPINTNMFNQSNKGNFGWRDGTASPREATTDVESPIAYYYVDIERVSNLNEIPNFSVGLVQTDNEGLSRSEFSAWLAEGFSSGQSMPESAQPIIINAQSDPTENTELLVAQEGDCTIDYMFDKRPLRLVGEEEFTVFSHASGTYGSGQLESYQHTHFMLLCSDKGPLRQSYFDAMENSCDRQPGNVESGWDAYQEAMKNAAKVLGNPDSAREDSERARQALVAARQAMVGKAASVTRSTAVRSGPDSYDIYAQVESNGYSSVRDVIFISWTPPEKLDDLKNYYGYRENWELYTERRGTQGDYLVDGQSYNYRFVEHLSDHNDERGAYITQIYAYNGMDVCSHNEATDISIRFDNEYKVNYASDGSSTGATAAQTLTSGVPGSAAANGFARGVPANICNAAGDRVLYTRNVPNVFDGWVCATATPDYYVNVADSGRFYGSNTFNIDDKTSFYTTIFENTIPGPFLQGEVYTLEFDAATPKNLQIGLSGGEDDRVPTVLAGNGTTSTSDTTVYANTNAGTPGEFVHFTVTFTIDERGCGDADKTLRVRLQNTESPNSAPWGQVRNFKFRQTKFAEGSRMINLSTGGDVTMTAQWKPGTFKLPGSEGSDSSEVGYKLVGWRIDGETPSKVYLPGETVEVGKETRFCEVTELKTYEVKYNANGGSGAPDAQTKTHGTALTLSDQKPTRTGYTFTGWNTKSNGSGTGYAAGASYTANADAELFAQWKANTFAVKYNANGGENAPADQTKTYGKTLTLSDQVPTREGYTFTVWNTKVGGGGTSYAPGASYTKNAAVTFYAQWTQNPFTLTYNANGGAGAPEAQQGIGTVTLSDAQPTRTGYSFLGWSEDPNATAAPIRPGAEFDLAADTTLYAVWKANAYAVRYNANGGEGAPANQTKTYGTALTLSDQTPTRAGYTFAVWNTKADGTGTSYAPGASYTKNATVTLYAQWTQNPFTLTYDANGGDGAPAAQQGIGAITLSAAQPARKGYAFRGWSEDPNATAAQAQAGAQFNLAADTTLYAVWEELPPPVVSIKNYTATKSVDYKTTITFTAITADAPADAVVHWFVDGKDVGTGETYKKEKATADYTVQCRLIGSDGSVLAESEVETVKVNTGFFAKLVAFFRGLFGKLPVIVQTVKETF